MNDVSRTFAALGDDTRQRIVARLARGGEAALSDLAEPFDMSQTAVSKHVRILSEAGLVRIDKRGRTRYCSLELDRIQQAMDWLETHSRFWADRFDALDRYLDAQDEGEDR